MDLDPFLLFKSRTMLEIWDCADNPGTRSLDEVITAYKEEARRSFGMDESAAMSLFTELVTEAGNIKKQMQVEQVETAKKEKENLEAGKKNRVIVRWSWALTLVCVFIYFQVTYHKGMGLEKWLIEWAWVLLFTVMPVYYLFVLIVSKIQEFIVWNQGITDLQKQIKENEQWVWHCQRCQANYAYNGQPEAVCGRCNNNLTKVRGMRI